MDEKVKEIDTAFAFKQTVYVINGIVFSAADSIQIDSSLQAYGLKHLVGIDILARAAKDLSFHNNDVVIVTFAHKQKSKQKRQLLKKVKQVFIDNYSSHSEHILNDAKDPVLYIDNERIHHAEAKKKIKALSLKSVYYIDYDADAASTQGFGQNAKNGVIKIWIAP